MLAGVGWRIANLIHPELVPSEMPTELAVIGFFGMLGFAVIDALEYGSRHAKR